MFHTDTNKNNSNVSGAKRRLPGGDDSDDNDDDKQQIRVCLETPARKKARLNNLRARKPPTTDNQTRLVKNFLFVF